jgi:Helix-turn-helix domain/PIF1-like helicase
MTIKHTEEFNLAYRFVNETNQNIFLTGKAGTGKTTFLKYLRENTAKKCVVAAPTGVAAINARGVTLHSLFQLPFGIILPDSLIPKTESKTFDKSFGTSPLNLSPKANNSLLSKIHYSKEKLNLLQNIELLIIDEASMVASYIVDAIDTILRYIRRSPYLPFGGVQVLFIGDLHQLPPVVKKEDWEILQDFYPSIFFFDSHVLQDSIPVIIEMTEIFRQKDAKFIEVLNGIRNNNISDENFKLLNSRINRKFMPLDNEGYITLTTHNYQSDEINKRKLSSLKVGAHIFHAEINDEFPENNFPAEKELVLKSGAQVMFLRNDMEDKLYFNGKIGTITELDRNYIRVKCKDDPYEIEVKKCEWQNIRYKVNPDTKEVTEEILGTFIQYPLRLAWAITIHKSQGLTFDKLIIDAEKAFATGQVYVALSRCTSLEGLVLKSPVYRNFLGAHKDFKEWKSKNLNVNLHNLFNDSRQDFIIQELQSIFTWQNWHYELTILNELLLENRTKIKAESIQWIDGLMNRQKELSEVSEKFKKIIHQFYKENSSVERSNDFQKRIKEAANYFHDEINKWKEIFSNHSLAVETKKLSRKIDSPLQEINSMINEILYKINYCKNGFLLDDYLKNGKSFHAKVSGDVYENIKSSYNKTLKVNTVEETVRYFREGKNIEQIAKERNLVNGTIEGHIAKAINQDLIELEEVMPLDEARNIAKFFPANLNDISLAAVKEKVPPEITYGELRMVLAWLEKNS